LSVIGILLQLAYRLHRHFIAGWSVARWLGTILVLASLGLLVARRAVTWDVILLAVLSAIYLATLVWAGRKRYVHFRPAPSAETLLGRAPATPALGPEELVPIQAGGTFTVHGQEQYYVDLDADYESVRSREHIILAQIPPSRFLGLGSWPDHELGYWYIFFQPAMLRQIRVGYLHFGSQPRLAVEVVYSPDDEVHTPVYLVSKAELLRRIWDDLMRDAPSDLYRSPSTTPGS
jgi:hypothetical protein